MNLDEQQISILIYESAFNSYKLHVARTKRIMDRANADYAEAAEMLLNMQYRLDAMRDAYLMRTV